MAPRKRLLRRRLPALLRTRHKFPRASLPPSYRPEWGGPFERFARNFVNKNYWRVANVVDSEEDALQECALIFAKCRDKYRYSVDNPKWFMSLFSIAVVNTWHGMARNDERQRDMIPFNIDDHGEPPDHKATFDYQEDTGLYGSFVRPLTPISYNEAPLRIAIREAPAEVRRFIRVIMNAPPDVLAYMLQPLPDHKAFNARLRRLCGFRREGIDIPKEINDLVRNN